MSLKHHEAYVAKTNPSAIKQLEKRTYTSSKEEWLNHLHWLPYHKLPRWNVILHFHTPNSVAKTTVVLCYFYCGKRRPGEDNQFYYLKQNY